MKVGIYLGNHPFDIGGGHTFENEVFYSLMQFGAGSGHSLALLSWDKEPPKEISLFSHVQFLSLHQSLGTRLRSKFYRVMKAILKKIQSPLQAFKIESGYNRVIKESLTQAQIDIVLNLSPFNILTVDFPYIAIIWDLQHRTQPYFPEVSSNGQWDWRENLFRTSLQRATAVITGTKTEKNNIKQYYQIPSENIKVLPLPTPGFTLKQSKKEEVFNKNNLPDNYLFYPAQFWPHKNHVGLLLAVKFLKDKYGLTFSVIFTGSDKGNESYIKQTVNEFGLSREVHFLGYVSQEHLLHLYRNAFALTFVTFFGPDNLPPLEAFALGCPVIASDVPGASEQLGEAAILVDPKEPENIALAIKSLWEDGALRDTLVRRGIERASRYSVKDYVKGILSIVDDFEAVRRCWRDKELYRII